MAIVPPGGFSGFQQMTPASKAALMKIGNATQRFFRKRRRKTKAKSSRKRARKSSGRLPKFGSPAWRKKYKLGKKRR